MVVEQLENDRDAFSEQFTLVLAENGVDEKEFESALNSHMKNPAFQRLVMQVMHPAQESTDGFTPTLSKDEAIAAFILL